MANKLNVGTIKPGETMAGPKPMVIGADTYFEVGDGDNGILLFVTTEDDMDIEILPGDSVFAGGPQKIRILYDELNCIYLESGRYVVHNPDGTKTIHLRSMDPQMDIVGYVLQIG